MKLTVCGKPFYARRMTPDDAKTVCSWRYTGEKEKYNAESGEAGVRSFLDGCHFALSEKYGGPVEAFACFGPAAALELEQLGDIYGDESYTDIAMGLSPDRCGKGLGRYVIGASILLADRYFPGDGFRVTVAADNLPALSVYSRLGFTEAACFDTEIIYEDNSGRSRTEPIRAMILTAPPQTAEKIKA